MTMPPEQDMILAVAKRNPLFDGVFYYGVITTGIFCQPSCSTKQAHPDHLRFFPNIESAMTMGFRPCKRCHPAGNDPRHQGVIDLARHIEKHVEEKITLESLSKIVKLSPSRLQKAFKDTFGISPKHYQDALRMKKFKQGLKQGSQVTTAIHASGFSSDSRVYGETLRQIGMTPKTYQKGGIGEEIHYACRSTQFGVLLMAATEKGVCCVQFGDDQGQLIQQLHEEFPNADLKKSSAQDSIELDHWLEALDQHVNHNVPRPNIPLDIRGTAFQITVWQFLTHIREGETMTYKDVAKKIGKPNAVRAVGTACGKNRIGVLIPCHRVLRSDGGLGGYRWGLERKKTLLNNEKQESNL
ncbi:methylated-DNA--[protein]-cysteine S-methyltransferase [Marinomonas sp. 5E14-1]|uniref:bifunctional transcriptional activator/DNA repair enzyme AdaA n=1 Tax=Marinomonas sp. 5E14-1 TaxID=3153922 RepID=UPI003264F675